MRHGLLRLTVVTLAWIPVAGSSVEAQMVTLDQGTFRISVEGEPTGTEAFSIRRSGGGADAQIIATGDIRARLPEGRLELRPALQTSSEPAMAVSAYQIRISGDREEEIFVTLGDRRFLTSTRSARGEQERELRAAPGTLLLDAGVAHQYYFLAQRLPLESATVPVIVPQEGRQYDLRVTEVGSETLTIGGQQVASRRLRLSGDRGERELWIDAEGLVLALEHPATGYRAVRERSP